MSTSEGKRLSELSTAVRESTLKRLRQVPDGCENWRIDPEAMSFADVAQHLIDADRWLFRKWAEDDLEPTLGAAGDAPVTDRAAFLLLVGQLEETGRRRRALLASATPNEFMREIYDGRFGGEVSAWWIVVRGNLDHEIHHRGQLAVFLRAVRPGRD